MGKKTAVQAAATEDAAKTAREADIIEALIDAGATVEPIDGPVDLLVGYEGRTLLVLLEERPEDGEFLERWRGKGGTVVTVASPAAALKALGRCLNGCASRAVPGMEVCADCELDRIYGARRPKAKPVEQPVEGPF